MLARPLSISSTDELEAVLKSTTVVIANVFSHASVYSERISAAINTLAAALTRAGEVAFVEVDFDSNKDLVTSQGIDKAPTILVFRDGKLKHQNSDLNPAVLKKFYNTVLEETSAAQPGSSSDAAATAAAAAAAACWRGAEFPRGFSDVSDQVEVRNCELLNADDDAGTVRALFESSKPSSLVAAGHGDGEGANTKDWIQSGSDDQLLLFIPFQSTVKLHTIQLTSLPSSDDKGQVSRPHVVHLFINRPQNMDFAEADDSEPTQVINLGPQDWNDQGTANVALRFVKYQKTTSLIIYIQQGDGEAEAVRLDRVRLIGEAGVKREMGTLKNVGADDE